MFQNTFKERGSFGSSGRERESTLPSLALRFRGFLIAIAVILAVATLSSEASATVTITAPASGATVSGTTPITCTDSYDSSAWVDIIINGSQVYSSNSPTGTYDWSISASPGTVYTLSCHGYHWTNGAVSDGTVSESVTVGPVSITAPFPGASVSGTVPITCYDAASTGSWVDIDINGSQVLSSSTPQATYNWNTAGLQGNYTIGCRGYHWNGGAVSDGSTSQPATVNSVSSTFEYDEVGRLITVVAGSGAGATYTYDAVGNLIAIGAIPSSTVKVESADPENGPVGMTVTIYGDGFDTTPGNNTVKFNGVQTTVTSASVASLTITVPSQATTGPISVSNSHGSAVSGFNFMVTQN